MAKAQTDGVCSVCGKPYSAGTRVRSNPDDRTKIAHEICGRRAAKRKRLLGEDK
jgi:hypothetical protein